MQTMSPLQRLLTFFQDVFLSIHKPFVFDVDYLNPLLPVKVCLQTFVVSEGKNSKLLQSITKNWDVS